MKYKQLTKMELPVMKPIFLTLFFFLLLASSCRKTKCPEPTTSDPINPPSVSVNELRVSDTLLSVCMTSNSVGYIVGDYGKAYKTSDGGDHWTKMPILETKALSSVFFTDQNTGFVTATSGKLYKTIDAGNSWNEVNTGVPAGASFTNSYFVDASTFYLIGQNGLLYKTVDGGTTFVQINTGSTNHIYNLAILTDGTMLLACNYATILRSTNNGATWSSSSNPAVSTYNISDLYFLSTTVGYTTAYNGNGTSQSLILKTTNGGISWSAIANPDLAVNGSYKQIKFVDNLVGYIVGGDHINQVGRYLKTTDGGNTWTVIPSNTKRLTNQVILNGVAYGVGFGGAFVVLN